MEHQNQIRHNNKITKRTIDQSPGCTGIQKFSVECLQTEFDNSYENSDSMTKLASFQRLQNGSACVNKQLSSITLIYLRTEITWSSQQMQKRLSQRTKRFYEKGPGKLKKKQNRHNSTKQDACEKPTFNISHICEKLKEIVK